VSTTTSDDGVSIAYRRHGGDGPPLLLAHATGFCGDAWRPVARILAERYSVWSLDFRGHGTSGRPIDGQFDWSGTALDVLAVIDAVDARERWLGVGHSMGGAAVLLAEQRRPSTFRALWAFEPIVMAPAFAKLNEGGNMLSEQAARRRGAFDSRSAARANFAGKPPMAAFDPEALDGYLDGGLGTLEDGRVELRCRPTDEAQVYLMGGRHDAWGHLDEVGIPVTVVSGSTATPGPSHFAAPLAEQLPLGRLDLRPELNHFGPFEQPERIADMILDAFRGA